MRVVEGAENVSDLGEAAFVVPEIDGIAALKVDLDENKPLIVLALDGFEEAAATQHLLKHEVVGGRQVVEVVLRGRRLRRARDLVAHPINATAAALAWRPPP